MSGRFMKGFNMVFDIEVLGLACGVTLATIGVILVLIIIMYITEYIKGIYNGNEKG